MTRLLIASSMKSGTLFLHRVLCDLGVRCTHERVFDYGVKVGLREYDWKDIQVEVSWLSAPFLRHLDMEGITLWHQVRNPLKCLTCYVSHRIFSDNVPANVWAKGQVSECDLNRGSDLERSVKFLYFWHRKIDAARPSLCYQVESLRAGRLSEMLLSAGFGYDSGLVQRALDSVPGNTNSCGSHGKEVTRDDVEAVPYGTELLEMFRGYGYDV